MYTVVLVDDEKGIIDGLKVIMRRYLPTCEVIGCAYDGEEGFRTIVELRPDIVITDIRMLRSDGLDMIERLTRGGSDSKFIILSGYSEFEYARRIMRSGVKYYLSKPIEETELQNCVNELIQEIEVDRRDERENKQTAGSGAGQPSLYETEMPKRKDVISEIKQYVTENFDRNISLADLSNRFFINLHYLSQLFKEKTGQTYLEYLTQVRISRSKDLLASSDLKIYEICKRVGYSDSAHFSKVFEKAVGCKPSDFRKMHTEEHRS
ncbi:response regulator transcription factor [Paenibacillus nasutitermitis]|uniref:Response regulatory protein n=1 Tax=Paenibacillus nasutitermitis TaxID=1652958 RepID=A0A916YT94_9BACL|nr:helix-turn-helix domain-containing protein [Paenibacillus nasutitermitis]GGD60689.1 putative response regulatory protein [Paenibacillus nasutitermitis]